MSTDFLYGMIWGIICFVFGIFLRMGFKRPDDQDLHFEITEFGNPPNKVFPSGGQSRNGGAMPDVANRPAPKVVIQKPEAPKNVLCCGCCGKIIKEK